MIIDTVDIHIRREMSGDAIKEVLSAKGRDFLMIDVFTGDVERPPDPAPQLVRSRYSDPAFLSERSPRIRLSGRRARLLRAYRTAKVPLSDADVAGLASSQGWGCSPNALRVCRKALCEKGLLEWRDDAGESPRGRKAPRYGLTPLGLRWCETRPVKEK